MNTELQDTLDRLGGVKSQVVAKRGVAGRAGLDGQEDATRDRTVGTGTLPAGVLRFPVPHGIRRR